MNIDGNPTPPTGDYDATGESDQPRLFADALRPRREQPGDRIGAYKLLQKIGEGGMGAVWMAEQSQPVRRQVAIKLIRPDLAADHFLARFEAERQALALMDHPNIARVFDAGTTESGAPYLVMELVKGVPFTQYCDDAKLTIRERVELFVPICRAVQHAHTKGVIHRDLKPTNILVALYDGKPVPKVIDFGIAKALHQKLTEKTLVTQFGSVVGTPEYMAPEQAEFNALDIDTRADIYSLGVILYETLAGTTPFDRKHIEGFALLELLRLIKETDPPAPSQKLSSVHTLPDVAARRRTDPQRLRKVVRGELDWVVMKALEKERSRRYTTADLFAEDLENYLSDKTVIAGPPSAGYRLRKAYRRNKGRVIAAGLLLVTLVGGLAVSISQVYRATRAESELRTSLGEKQAALDNESRERRRAEDNAELARKKTNEAEFESYVANLVAAHASLAANEPVQVRTRLDSCPARLRNWEWRFLNARADQSSAILTGHVGEVLSAEYSPSGNHVVTASNDKTARVWDAVTGKELAVLRGHESEVVSARFSPSGDRIVTVSEDKSARIWDTATGKELSVLRVDNSGISSASFSPLGDRVVTAETNKTARVWDASTGKELVVLRGHGHLVRAATFNPTGDRIVTASWDNTARVWDASTGKELVVLRGHEGQIDSASFSGSGLRVVTASWDGTARVWDAETGKEVTIIRLYERADHRDSPPRRLEIRVQTAAFSPTGDRIITASGDRTAHVWDATTGKELAVLRGHESEVRSAVINARGDRVVTASYDNTARMWDAATGEQLAILRGHEGGVISAAFSPAGDRIVTASVDRTAREWATAVAEQPVVLRGHEGQVDTATYALSGDRVLTAAQDNTARVWDVISGRQLVMWRGVHSAAFSLSCDRVLTVGLPARVCDAMTGKELTVLDGNYAYVNSAEFSPQGDRIVLAVAMDTAKVWDVKTGRELAVLRGHEREPVSAKFNALGDCVVTASFDGTARVWDASTGKELVVLRGHLRGVRSASFSPSGVHVVTASYDRTARIWEATSGKELVVLQGHEREVNSASFSPSGDRIVTASYDRTARVWEASTGKELVVLRGHQGAIKSAAFSASGDCIVTASEDKTVRIWDSISYRERYPAIAASRTAFETMTSRLTPRIKAGEDLDAIAQSLVDDKSLDETHRRMGLAVVCEEREKRRATKPEGT